MVNRESQSGFSSIELLAAITITSVVFTAILSLLSYVSIEINKNRALSTRNRMLDQLVRYAGTPAALRASGRAPEIREPFNKYFKRCIFAIYDGDSCITNNGDGEYRPFRLYLPVMDNTPSDSGYGFDFLISGAITGTPQYPVRYDERGVGCDTSTAKCSPDKFMYEVFTEFLPTCPRLFDFVRFGWTNIKLTAMYPDGLKIMPECANARFVKVKITLRPSGPKYSFSPRVEIVPADAQLARTAQQ